jgi:predicted DNA binding protein
MAFKDEKGVSNDGWKVLEVLGEVQKNKSDVIRLTKVSFKGNEYVQIQTWRNDQETGNTYPLKNSNIVFKPELAEKLAEILAAV